VNPPKSLALSDVEWIGSALSQENASPSIGADPLIAALGEKDCFGDPSTVFSFPKR
jgi:hypothetical protein